MRGVARKKQPIVRPVSEEMVRNAIAHTVATGDLVGFRFLFSAHSPCRLTSPDRLEDAKYGYLTPDSAVNAAFDEALAQVTSTSTWAHIQAELSAERPARLPSELVLALADNALRAGKYTLAAQAYELLRIRRKMQEEFHADAGAALKNGEIARSVRGFRIAAALGFDYAAFPEPMPMVSNYQSRALMLHGRYPLRPEDCIALQEAKPHVETLLGFLLDDPEAVARLRDFPPEVLLDFAVELVAQVDPDWSAWQERYAEAVRETRELSESLMRSARNPGSGDELEDAIAGQQERRPERIMEILLGRAIPDGEWWQYLKEVAYTHPAGILFVSRQLVGDKEVFLPRCREDSALAAALGLKNDTVAGTV